MGHRTSTGTSALRSRRSLYLKWQRRMGNGPINDVVRWVAGHNATVTTYVMEKDGLTMADMLETYAGSAEQIARDEETASNLEKWRGMGKGWEDMLYAAYRSKRKGIELHRISIRVGWVTGMDSLVTLVAHGDEGGLVSFHGAENPTTMWERLAKRWLSDSLEWREDSYERKK